MTEQGVIYGLTHNGEVRYVGKTTGTTEDRLVGHMQSARRGNEAYRDRWIRSVDYDVQIIVLEENPVGGLNEAEKAWIATCRRYRCRLTNLTEGGDGFDSALAREAGRKGGLALRGKPKSAEARAKISATLTGRKNGPHSDETRAKISAKRKGKPCNHKQNCKCLFCTDPGYGARVRWSREEVVRVHA